MTYTESESKCVFMSFEAINLNKNILKFLKLLEFIFISVCFTQCRVA